MTTIEVIRQRHGLTPVGLAAMVLLAGLVAALLGAEPLDNWAADALADPDLGTARQLIQDWHEVAERVGLTYPLLGLAIGDTAGGRRTFLRRAVPRLEGHHAQVNQMVIF